MSDADDTFECHRCGACCTHLKDLWDSNQAPTASPIGASLYRLPTPGGLRLFAWETTPFERGDLEPLLVAADTQRERLVALAYELDADTCPQYDDEDGCTIYPDRPLVCQAYPLLVLQSPNGPQVAESATCNARAQIANKAHEAEHPEQVLAQTYPDAFAPALAVPALLKTLTDILQFLATANILTPATNLDPDQLDAYQHQPSIDLVTLVEDAGVMTRQDLQARAKRTVDTLHERWRSPTGEA